MIIQSAETISLKEQKARKNIGKHFLIGIACKNGWVFGKVNNRRSSHLAQPHKLPSWVSVFDSRILTATIGDLGDAKEFLALLASEQEELAEIVTPRYVSGEFTEKAARLYISVKYERQLHPFGLSVVITSLDDPSRFALVNYDGKLKEFRYFVVAGCLADHACVKRKKEVIDFLASKCGKGQSSRWRAEGTGKKVLVDTFRRFDQPAKEGCLELFWFMPPKWVTGMVDI